MEKKYELLMSDSRSFNGETTVFRIRALRDFGAVKTGDLGGFVASEHNLSHEGTCWIYDNAIVTDNAEVKDSARTCGQSVVKDRARVSWNAMVNGSSCVSGEAKISGSARVSVNSIVTDRACVKGDAVVTGSASISGDSIVMDSACIEDSAIITGSARVSGQAVVKDYAKICGDAEISGSDCVKELSIIVRKRLDSSDYKMKELELLPCPFCRGAAEQIENIDDSSVTHYVKCTNCKTSTGVYGTKEESANAWNRRTPADPQWTTEPPKEEGWYRVWYSGTHVDCIEVVLCKQRQDIYGLGIYIDTESQREDRFKFYSIAKYVDKFGVKAWCKLDFPLLPEGKECNE